MAIPLDIAPPGSEEKGAPIVDAAELPHAAMTAILDSATQGIVVHRGGPPLYVNRTMMQLVGVKRDSPALLRPILEWIHPHDRNRVATFMRARMLGRGAPRDYEFRLLAPRGGELWISCRAMAIQWTDGPAVLASCYDITPHKQVERAQERSETLFKRVFQATPDMVCLSYLDTGIFLDVNDNFARAIGMSRKDILGQSIFDLEIWDEPAMAMRIRAMIRRHGSIRQMKARIRRADGESFPISFSAESLVVDGAEVLLLIGRDITDDLAREEELCRSRDAAELANRAKSEFLANMSHELRTPLNAILGFSEIIGGELLGPLGDPRYREYAEDIHRSGAHLLAIINDILDLSKVEAGRLEIRPHRIDVEELISGAVRLVRERAQTAGLALAVEITPPDLAFHADDRLCKQILLNLLTNAIKFTPQGGRISVQASAQPEGGCRLVVADSGVGMSDDEIRRALMPFGQVDSVLTRSHEGTGLGLPLVSAFVAAHGGRFEIRSEKGAGTTATVILPDVAE
ncbi:MAG: PAS domain S-box protein [Alphaproteobacteria bacterium]|nr:MAG: PAS domain S-box protein [Alphaproteobacteria bacterium]